MNNKENKLNKLIEKLKIEFGVESILFIVGVPVIIYSINFFPLISEEKVVNPIIHLTYFIAFMFIIGSMFIFMGFQMVYYKNLLSKLEIERILRLLNSDEKFQTEVAKNNKA